MNEVDVMKGLHNAHTGIASDTPVSVHLTHIWQNVGIQPRMKNVSYGCPELPTLEWWGPLWNGGSYLPILEAMGLLIHSRGWITKDVCMECNMHNEKIRYLNIETTHIRETAWT